jgi:hypothetical protein
MADRVEKGESMAKTAQAGSAPKAIGTIAEAQRRLDELAASGAKPAQIERFIVDVFVERNRSIRNVDFQRLDPRSVSDDYLKPRAELYRFVVVRWIRLIFLPSLKPKVADELFMFGLGRLFSSYNDMGVQHCTDVDLNIVAGDGLGKAELERLAKALEELRRRLLELFGIVLEIDPAYTILRACEVAARLEHDDEGIREANARFYKSNERSISVIKDHGPIREGLFALVRGEPDARIFENFLGLKGAKPSYAKLRAGAERLSLIAEGGEKVLASAVIGSKPFEAYCRRALPQGHFLSPPDWVFSMKYFVNRVYDYVGAMRCQGYSLEEIGFDAPVRGDARGSQEGIDPDYRFLRNAHKLMLYLQELITMAIGSFGGARCDYSYISRSRFLRLMEIDGDKFRSDFEEMVLGGDLLLQSEKKDFMAIKRKAQAKARDRFLELKSAERNLLPPGFAYETVHRDDYCARICVPYTWADLGYYVFTRIAARIGRIVDSRLSPRLPSFGMPADDYRQYADTLG